MLHALSRIIISSLEELKNLISSPKELNREWIDFELERRFFVRKFSLLGERLIYFRGKSDEMTETDLIYLKDQLDSKKPVSEAIDMRGNNLVEQFTAFRNKLLHKYLYEHHREDDRIFDEAKIYFENNCLALKENLEKTLKNTDIRLDKISYDVPPKTNKIIFSRDYLLPLEVTAREIEILLEILKFYKIDIDSLSKHNDRLSKERTSQANYKSAQEKEVNKLNDCFKKTPYLKESLENLIENISVSLGKLNKTYDEILGNKHSEFEELLLDYQEKLYDNLDQETADFFQQIAKIRIGTAHENESGNTAEPLIDNFVLIKVLYESYVKKSLDFLTENSYNDQPKKMNIDTSLLTTSTEKRGEKRAINSFSQSIQQVGFFSSSSPQSAELQNQEEQKSKRVKKEEKKQEKHSSLNKIP